MNEQKFTGIRYLIAALENGTRCDFSYHVEYHCKDCLRNRLLIDDICALLEYKDIKVNYDEDSAVFLINDFKYIIYLNK